MPDSRASAAPGFRCLIVDDERLAREGIAALLSDDPRFVIVGEANGGRGALGFIEKNDVDVVFLDVQMPGVDGFQFLESLRERHRAPIEVVFVTAFDDYAVRAFEAAALDYLLKPVDEERFHATLDRVAGRLSERAVVRPDRGTRAYLSRFAVRSVGRTIFVAAKEVHLIEADGYCVKLHAVGRTHVLRATMAALEARLDPAHFVRVHRSAIVNMEQVVEMRPYDRGHYTLLLRSGHRVRMSRKRREHLGALFG